MSTEIFLRESESALRSGTFLRLTLARPATGEARRQIILRPAEIRGAYSVQVTHRYPTRDEVENLSPVASLALLTQSLGDSFLDAHLETLEAMVSLRHSRRGEARISRRKNPTAAAPLLSHDRRKNLLLDPVRLPWLHDLGLADASGKILPSGSAKWRQVGRFVELISHAWADVSWECDRALEVVDMGCGKGYLTFALEAWFTDGAKVAVQVRGVEQRPGLVEAGNAIATRHGRSALRFETGQIGGTQMDRLDLLVALHACDTATDDALALGVRHGARMIVCAPCCQHELRESMQGSDVMAGMLDHGLFRQRQAELLTDTLRTLVLEREGYHVRVVEFISAEHTDKNLLLIATRHGKKSSVAAEKIAGLKSLFGLPGFYLETLLPC